MTTRGLVSAAAFSLAGCASAPLLAARGADALLRELVERHRFQGAVVIGHGPRRPGRVRRRIRLCRHRTATALHARHADRWRLDGSARDRAAPGPGTARRRAQHRHHTGQLARLGRRQTADGKRETANGKRQTANGKRRYYTGSHNGFFCFDCVDEARNIAIAWVANDGPPSWLQPALSRALMAIAEGRVPEPLVAPQAADPTVDPSVVPTVVPTVDPSGRYRVNAVGEVSVQRDGQQLHVRHRGVQYQGFPVARGVHDVPGLDACLRFSSTAQAPAALSWDSVFVAVPSVARDGPDADR